MESTHHSQSTGRKTSWLVGGAVLAILAVVYFSFFYPPTSSDDATGTIGAAKKYRSDQISEKDVQLVGQEAISEDAAIGANVEAFDRMTAANKTALVSRQTEEARNAIFAAFSAENASAVLDRVPLEALKEALARMSPEERDAKFFALMPALDRAAIALKTSAADLDAAYAALDLSEKSSVLEKFAAANKAKLYDRYIAGRQEPAKALSVEAKATDFNKVSATERVKTYEAMSPAERFTMLKNSSLEAAAPVVGKVAADALTKSFLAMKEMDQRAIYAKVPAEGRMTVYNALPVDAKTMAFKSLSADQQKAIFDRLPVESKNAMYKTVPVDQRSVMEGKAIPVEERTNSEGKTAR